MNVKREKKADNLRQVASVGFLYLEYFFVDDIRNPGRCIIPFMAHANAGIIRAAVYLPYPKKQQCPPLIFKIY